MVQSAWATFQLPAHASPADTRGSSDCVHAVSCVQGVLPLLEAAKMSSTHLVIILDLAPTSRLHPAFELEHWISSAVSFGISHLALNSRNGLTVFASHFNINECVYAQQPREAIACTDGQYEKFAAITEEISRRLYALVSRAYSKVEGMKGSKKDHKAPEPAIAAGLSLALCFINKKKSEYDHSRVAIISPNVDDTYSLTSQYMIFMNCFFTAQKLDVPIDVAACAKSSDNSANSKEETVNSILRQGCDITNGIYLPILNLKSLLQYLTWSLLPDVETRKSLVLPKKAPVGSKTACFCHRTMLDIGYVCSVCLSVFCTFSPICSTCEAISRLSVLPVDKRNKQPATDGN